MVRRPLKSTMLASAGYSADQAILEVEFQSGETYQFFGVPQSCFVELLAAESKGRFFNRFIRDHFAFEQINRKQRAQKA